MIFLAFAVATGLRAAYAWRNVAIGGGGYVTGLVYHPAEANLLYARTDVGGAYRWNQVAGRWLPLNDDIGGLNNDFMTLGVLSIALDPADTNRVYLACGQYIESWAPSGRLLRSTDRGITWTQITLPFKLAGNDDGRGTGERLAVDPANPAHLLLGTSADGLWSSTDRGSTWTRASTFTPAAATFVLFDAKTAGVVYAGAPALDGTSLWRSSNGGVNWTSVPGAPNGVMAQRGVVDSVGTLYLTFADSLGPNGATIGSVWKLANAATTTSSSDWTNINPPTGNGGYCGLSLDPQRAGVVLVSTLDRWSPRDEVYISTNGGTSWGGVLVGATMDLSQSPWVSTITPHWITDVEIDPFNSAHASFVTGYGVFTTNNLTVATGKPTWTFSGSGLEETVPTGFVSPLTGASLVSTIGDFDGFRHDNVDAAPATRLTPRHGGNRTIAGAGTAPAVLARLYGTSGSVSRDGGTTWTEFATSPTTINDNGKIAVSADGARLLWCPPSSTPYWSSDDGAHWTASLGAPDGSGGLLHPAADRVNAGTFFIFDPVARVVMRSTDGGVTFSAVSGVLPAGVNSIGAAPGVTGELWATAGTNGLIRVTNNGATVSTVTAVQAAYTLGFGMAAPNATYPAIFIWGTKGGVTGIYRSDDTGASWVRVNDDAHQFGRIANLTGDPRVYGRVYLGTSGRGVMLGEPVVTPLASSIIYADAVVAGWNNGSWATVNYAATTPVRRGTNAISVNAGSFAAIALNRASTAYIDTSGYTALGFWIHGGTTGGQSLRIRALRAGANQPAITLTAPSANTWTRVVIPLSSLGIANVPDFSGFLIQNLTGSTLPVFYLDDIALVGALDAAAWQTQVYSDWRTVTFTALQAATDSFSGPTADPDQDGRNNRLEWLLASDPLTADVGADSWASIALSTDATNATFYDINYVCRVVTGADVPVVETSSDLQTWTVLAAAAGTTTSTQPVDIAGSTQRVFWHVPAAGKTRWFVRMR